MNLFPGKKKINLQNLLKSLHEEILLLLATNYKLEEKMHYSNSTDDEVNYDTHPNDHFSSLFILPSRRRHFFPHSTRRSFAQEKSFLSFM